MNKNPSFDLFVEKVVRHNKLVPKDKLQKAKNLQKNKPQLTLLDILVRTKLIQQAHVNQINTLYKKTQKESDKSPLMQQTDTSSSTITSKIDQISQDKPPKPDPQEGTTTGIEKESHINKKDKKDSNELMEGGFETTSLSAFQSATEQTPPSTHFQQTKTDPAEKQPFERSTKSSDSFITDKNQQKAPVTEKEAPFERSKQTVSRLSEKQSSSPDTQSIDIFPTSNKLFAFLEKAKAASASDLHIVPDASPIIRLHGAIQALEQNPFSPEETEQILFGVLDENQQKKLRKNLSLDFCLNIKNKGRFRSCIVKQDIGWDGAFRIIQDTIPNFEDLGLPDEIKRMTEFQQGLVLVTGTSGMGKTTTMTSMINHINQNRNEHIITLEEPIEYVIHPVQSHISQREVPTHTQSYSTALRAALREDPDVIMIGELRDEETASLAITAAETGHLVFASLPTNSATQTITRLLDFFSPDQQPQVRAMISESIRGIICQQLIPNQSKSGRVLALEIMFNIPAIGNLMREDRLHQLTNTMRLHHKIGMMMMDDSIKELLKSKLIDAEEAHFAIVDQLIFQKEGPS